MLRKSYHTRFAAWLLPTALCFLLGSAAYASTTYYVSPTGSGLSTNSSSPGSLETTVTTAASGSSGAYNTIILQNGTYNGSSYGGFTVDPSYITLQAQNWHGATIENTTSSTLIQAGSSSIDVTCQGIVFGPATSLGWSGGGSTGWEFLDCEFTQNGGVGAGNNCVFENDIFSDAYSNAIDLAGTGQSIINCVIRRSNRSGADDDAVGNKQDFTTNLLVNGLVDYDSNGPSLWYDTSNDGWTIENSTFFANHGGNNWYNMSINSGSSKTAFNASGQDGAGFSVGQKIMGIAGTSANIGAQTVITAISGSNITVSPALPAIPAGGDTFAAQQGAVSSGDGFVAEADDNGTFTNNVDYSNTDRGYFDHSSGGTTYGGTGGLTITHNLFAYNPLGGIFVWSDARDQGPATIQYNSFLFTPGSSNAFNSWGSTPGTYPRSTGIDFDYNDYDATNSEGNWSYWFSNPVVAGGLTAGSQPSGQETVNGTLIYQDYLQNTSTWDQDIHGNTNSIAFVGTPPTVFVWPAATDTNWSDDYFGNNTFGTSNTLHQINDTNGSSSNNIDGVIDGKASGSVLTIPVSAHSPLTGSGPYTCQVYDLNGRWVTLTVPAANESTFLSAVPSYVTCTTSNATQTYDIQVTLNSTPPYNVTATYNPSGGGGGGYTGSLSGSYAGASTSTYNLTSLGTSDWAHWNGTYNHKSSGGSQISNVTQIGSGNYGTWNLTTRNVSWSDGTPVTSNSDDQNYIWCNDVANSGWTFTAPASTTSRTLNVLLGGATGATIQVIAHLSDDTGDTKDYSTSFTLGGSSPMYLFTFTYAAASAGQTIKITLTTTTTSAASVDLDAAWLTGGGGVSGSLSGSEATASTSTYALTTLGTTDWSHWNDNGWIHDSSGGSQISNVTQTGGGSFGNWDVTSRNVSWTNGTPTASNSDDDYYIWCNGTTGQGWTFTAPATTTSHTLYILAGGDGGSPYAAIKLNAHLSDGSASDYTDTRTTTTSANLFLYTITYNAASAGKTLTITLTKNDTDSATSVDLDAAWLH